MNLFFTKSRHDKDIVWMLTHYVLCVWDSLHVKESDVKLDQFIGYLKFKFKQAPIKLNDLQIFSLVWVRSWIGGFVAGRMGE